MTSGQATKKLIEVALPLEEINAASKAYKDRKVGTIRNLHKWFAPMPLPAWRALIFAALIDDPDDDAQRASLLDLTKRLVITGADLPDAATLAEAQEVLRRQFPDGLPAVFDPFCGGGSTLVEAQRLGLRTLASDLNPVPVLITRTLTDLLPKVYGQPALHTALTNNPGQESELDLSIAEPRVSATAGLDGIVSDIEHYAGIVHDEARRILGRSYSGTSHGAPIAWLWSRTVTCPNPACGIETVATTSWWVSKKKGDLAWIEPSVEGDAVRLKVVSGQRSGTAPDSPKVGRATYACLKCRATLDESYLRAEGLAGRLGLRMTVVVEESDSRRTYREPTDADLRAAQDVEVDIDVAAIPLVGDSRNVRPMLYGLTNYGDLFLPRQLFALSVLSDCVAATYEQVLRDGGTRDRATAIASVLALSVGKSAQANSSQVRWNTSVSGSPKAEPAFGRNDLPMLWDFAETYPFGASVGSFLGIVSDQVRALKYVAPGVGHAIREDARTAHLDVPGLVATDPPYFDAIGYADLSDYFYLWHRRALRTVHPDLYGTVAAPKTGELTAIPSHHGNSKSAARDYFIAGFTEAFGNLKLSLAAGLPMLVVYASKEQQGGSEEETRWSSILTAMVQADLEITGTWPIHGTTAARMIGNDTNSVASYVVMACRPRPETAGTCSLADFNRALRRELKPAVHALQAAGILPVDLAQAAMGPGMQIYSRYRQVVDQSGTRVPVEKALRLINAALGEVLDEQEGELDPDSRFAITWWEKYGWEAASFGEADQLARPQGISVDDVVRAGVASFPRAGYVSLLGSGELDREWTPSADRRPTAWEAVHHLADRLIGGGGEREAGRLMGQLGLLRDPAQSLVYRLHAISVRRGRTRDQERYNALIGSWSDLLAIAATEKDGLF